MRLYDDYLRWLYRGRRPHWFARVQNRASAVAFGAGVWPQRLGALEVRGRKSGRSVTLPVVIAELDGERYLVSMLGERAGWVANVRADGGRAVLRHGRRDDVLLEEVPVAERAPIIQRYLKIAPGARPHIDVDRQASVEEFERIAGAVPVFRVRPREPVG